VFPASQLGFKHRPLGRMVQSEPETTFPETKTASMAKMNSAIGGNLTVPMTRIRMSTMIALKGPIVLSRKPRELLVGAAFDSRADNRAPMDQRSFRPHYIHRPVACFHEAIFFTRTLQSPVSQRSSTLRFLVFLYLNELVSVYHESCSHISS
jgi:hypothetical protein